MLGLRSISAALFLLSALHAAAAQSLDMPDGPVFGDKIPKKEKKVKGEITFESKATIVVEKSALILCSEFAAGETDGGQTIDDCDRAVLEYPEDGDAYYYRGVARYDGDDYEAAEADFTAAIDHGASLLAESYYRRGVCKENLRLLKEASSDFKKAAELKPEWSAARRKVDEYQWAYE